jgi:hypothetical protein
MQTDFRDNEAELRRRDGAKRHCRETLHNGGARGELERILASALARDEVDGTATRAPRARFHGTEHTEKKVVSNGNQNERRKQSGKGQKRKRSSPQ